MCVKCFILPRYSPLQSGIVRSNMNPHGTRYILYKENIIRKAIKDVLNAVIQ